MEVHPSQLMVCHEKIDPHEGSAAHPEATYQWCSLPAHAWCLDDGYYVCSSHIQSRHERHHIQTRQQEADEPAERRSGTERRKENP